MNPLTEPTLDQIEKRARELSIQDGLDPDQPATEAWDKTHPGARWRGYAEQARQELLAEALYVGPLPDEEQP